MKRVKGGFSLTKDIFFSHRPHRFNRTFPPMFRSHRRPPAYRIHRGLTPNPSPIGEGSSMCGYPFWPAEKWRRDAKRMDDIQGYLGNHSPLHSERGWGWGYRRPSAYRDHRALLLMMVVMSVLSVDLMSLWTFVCSVLLCSSVRERNILCERKKYPPWEKERSYVRERNVLRER